MSEQGFEVWLFTTRMSREYTLEAAVEFARQLSDDYRRYDVTVREPGAPRALARFVDGQEVT